LAVFKEFSFELLVIVTLIGPNAWRMRKVSSQRQKISLTPGVWK